MPTTVTMDAEPIFGRLGAETLAKKVTDQVREAIYSGKLKPGDRIVELRLSQLLGVGQSSVREGLKELEHLGLIVKYPNRGSFVVDLSKEENLQIYLVRSELEGLAIRLALPRRSPGDITELRLQVLKMQEAASAKDFNSFVDADFSFHRHLWRISGNPFLEEALLNIGTRQFAFYRVEAIQGRTYWDMDRLVKKHAEIVSLLEGRGKKSSNKLIDELRDMAMAGLDPGDEQLKRNSSRKK
jgi:DNA-binding GntR family transcriptional regulator